MGAGCWAVRATNISPAGNAFSVLRGQKRSEILARVHFCTLLYTLRQRLSQLRQLTQYVMAAVFWCVGFVVWLAAALPVFLPAECVRATQGKEEGTHSHLLRIA